MCKELTSSKSPVAGLVTAMLLIVAPLASSAQQAPTGSPVKGKTVVLLEGDGTIQSLGKELVEGGERLGRAMQLSGLALEDLMVAVGCAVRQPACLKKIGESIETPALLLVNARAVANKVEALFHLFDVASAKSTGRTTVLLPLDPMKRKPVLGKALGTLYGVEIEKAQAAMDVTGTLFIAASQRRAEIFINGQPRGSLPLDLRDMPVGSYKLRARLQGFHDWEGSVKVRANQLTRVYIDMIPSLRDAKRRPLLEAIRLPTWIVAGVGAASLGVGAIFGAHMAAQQHEFDDTPAETQNDINQLRSLKETGERDAVVANVLLGIGGAALITAVVMAYIDYRVGRQEPQSASPDVASVVVGPGVVQVGLRF